MSNVTFYATDLASKWGFCDGDILSEFELWDLFETVDEHEVLIRLVRDHLLPLLPELTGVDEIETCHNPIRARTEADNDFCEDSDVSVKITEEMVLAVAARVTALDRTGS